MNKKRLALAILIVIVCLGVFAGLIILSNSVGKNNPAAGVLIIFSPVILATFAMMVWGVYEMLE
jgi:hypothetical protein